MKKQKPENYYKKYTDAELTTILLDAPTKANAIKHSLVLQRNSGAIANIYKWAMTPQRVIDERGRGDDSFVKQIKRVAKKRAGWLA